MAPGNTSCTFKAEDVGSIVGVGVGVCDGITVEKLLGSAEGLVDGPSLGEAVCGFIDGLDDGPFVGLVVEGALVG